MRLHALVRKHQLTPPHITVQTTPIPSNRNSVCNLTGGISAPDKRARVAEPGTYKPHGRGPGDLVLLHERLPPVARAAGGRPRGGQFPFPFSTLMHELRYNTF